MWNASIQILPTLQWIDPRLVIQHSYSVETLEAQTKTLDLFRSLALSGHYRDKTFAGFKTNYLRRRHIEYNANVR